MAGVIEFVQRPVTVTALQWQGREESWEDFRQFYTNTRGDKLATMWNLHFGGYPDAIRVCTAQGEAIVLVGEWIIRGSAGEWFTLPDAVFRARYTEKKASN